MPEAQVAMPEPNLLGWSRSQTLYAAPAQAPTPGPTLYCNLFIKKMLLKTVKQVF